MWRGKKQTRPGCRHLDVGDTRLPRQGKKRAGVQTTEANEGQVDMWSSNKQQQSNTRPGVVETQQRRGGEQSKQPGSSQCKMRIGLDWIGLDRLMNGSLSLLMAAQWPPVAGRGPDSVRLSSTPLVEPRIGIRVVGNNKAEPLDCPLTNGSQVRADGRQAGQGGLFAARSRATTNGKGWMEVRGEF